MGAAELLNDPSSLYKVDYVENVDLSDTDLVQTVKKALISLQTGESDLYNELIGVIVNKEYFDPDAVALLEKVLKALSGSVAYIDVIHHQKLLASLFGMRLWDHNPGVMDVLLNLVISLAVTSGKYLDPCLNMLIVRME